MNLTASISILVTLTAGHAAPSAPDAMSIILAADAAGKTVKTAEYTVEGSFAGTKVKSTVWQVNGKVPDTGYATGKYRVKGTSESNGDIEFFDFAYDGKALRVRTNTDDVRVVNAPDTYSAGQQIPQASGITRMSVLGDWQWLLDKKPQLRLLPAKKIGNWTCDVVEVKYTVNDPAVGETTVQVEWAFDRVSHLPIQRSSSFATVTVLKLKLNAPIDDKIFRLEGKRVDAKDQLPATDDLLTVGSVAPDFSVRDGRGKLRTLKSYRGRVLVLDFWGTWCLPCRKTMPILQKLHAQYGGKRVEVLGISLDREADPVTFMKRMKYTYPIALNGAKAARAYKAVLLPTTYVIDPNGKIAFRQAGIDRNDAVTLPKAVKLALVRA